MLSNPDLIENFTGKTNLDELFSKSTDQKSKILSLKKNSLKSSLNGDIKELNGDIGTDFSYLIDETPIIKEKKIPETAESLDYYSSVFIKK